MIIMSDYGSFYQICKETAKTNQPKSKNRNSAHHGQTYEHNYNYDAALGFEGK